MTVYLPLCKPHLRRANVKNGNHTAQKRDTQRPEPLDARLRSQSTEGSAIRRGIRVGNQHLVGGLLKDAAADLDAKRGHLGVAGDGKQGGALELDLLGRHLEGPVEHLDQRRGQDVGRVAAVYGYGEALSLARSVV